MYRTPTPFAECKLRSNLSRGGIEPVRTPVVAGELDLAQLARSAGIDRAKNVVTSEAVASALSSAFTDGPEVLVLSTEPDIEVVRPPITFDPVLTKQRFMTVIGAARYIPTLFGGGRLESK
jgi:hypothetical protein